jgi:dihydrofolate reductase
MKSIKVICWNIQTPNGFIARQNGREDFLPGTGWYEWVAETHKYNNFILGRETYEIISKFYKGMNFTDSKAEHKLLVTSQKDYSAPGFVTVHSPEEALDYLAKHSVKTALLSGGGRLNGAFAERHLIDQLELIITPYLIGTCRAQLFPGNYEAKLDLKTCEQLPKGRVKLVYVVTWRR